MTSITTSRKITSTTTRVHAPHGSFIGKIQESVVIAEHYIVIIPNHLLFLKRPSARTGTTEIIANDLGHIVDEKHRSSSSPWGSFIGTWQAERKPIQLLTSCEFQIVSKKGVNDTVPTTGTVVATDCDPAEMNKLAGPANTKSTTDESKIGTPVQTVSQKQEPEPVKNEPVATLEPGNDRTVVSLRVKPQGSGPESQKAHTEVPPPLGSCPPSTISKVTKFK